MNQDERCPLDRELAGLVQCSLDEASSEKIAEHLVDCPVCEETVVNLEKTVAERWKRVAGEQDDIDFGDEPECQELLKAVSSPDFLMKGDTVEIDSGAVLRELREYKDLEQIGQGGMGTVYKARHSRLDRIVALKALPSNKVFDPHAVARFDREMKAVGKLDHPNIVRAMDAGEHNGQHYLVMEYVDGIDVGKLASKLQQLPVAEACEIVRQAAIGLQHAHENGLVHRDIKPGNLMLTKSGQVKILDLGLALLNGPGDAAHTELTSHGQVMGTLDYMAPEQGGNTHGVDIRADIYALGATLYRLLTGSAPFNGDKNYSVMQKLTALATQQAPDVREKRPDVDKNLAGLVARLLEKDPARRLQTPVELVDALAMFCDGADLQALVVRATGGEAGEPTTQRLQQNTIRPTKPQSARSAKPSAGLRIPRWMGIALAAGFAGIVFLGVLLKIQTSKGLVEIELADGVDAESVSVAILQNGKQIDIVDQAHGWSIRVRDGEYQVQLAGASDQFDIDKDSITVSRDRTAIVKVRRKPSDTTDSTVASTMNSAAIFPEPSVMKPSDSKLPDAASPFVVMKDGKELRAFKTFFAAYELVGPGDVVEIRSNAILPVPLTERIAKPLHLRAANGYRPMIAFSGVQSVDSDLTVENCDLDMRQAGFQGNAANASVKAPIWTLSGCRVWGGLGYDAGKVQVRDSIVVLPGNSFYQLGSAAKSEVELRNCIIWNGQTLFVNHNVGQGQLDVQMIGCTYFAHSVRGTELIRCPEGARAVISAKDCLFSVDHFYGAIIHDETLPQIEWSGSNNCYVGHWFRWDQGLTAWNQHWGKEEIGSFEIPVLRFDWSQTENLAPLDRLARIRADVQTLKEDARVAWPDQAEPNWELIGPGDGYVRALAAEGRPVAESDLRPERLAEGAFVLIRKEEPSTGFPTLAAAIDAAETGDIVEIRTELPVPSLQVDGQGRLLTIRAAAGYQPVIESLAVLHGGLILEGLTLQKGMGFLPSEAGKATSENSKTTGFVRLMNCATPDSMVRGPWMDNQSVKAECVNCVFAHTHFQLQSGKTLTMRNSIVGTSYIDGESTEGQPGILEIDGCVYWRPGANLNGLFSWTNNIQLRSKHSLIVTPRFLTHDGLAAGASVWQGDSNVFVKPSFFHENVGSTLADFQEAINTDPKSIELPPLQFDPRQWTIAKDGSPGYRPLSDGKDFGATLTLQEGVLTKPAIPMGVSEAGSASLFPELGQQEPALAAIDWPNIEIFHQPGLLPTWQPVKEGSDLTWQMRPWLETVGPHIGGAGKWLADLDPTGKYLGVVTEADAKVIELETGRVTHAIPAPPNSRWLTIRLSANADRVVLSDSMYFEVRDRRNRIVSQWHCHETEWFRKPGVYFIVHTMVSWCVPGESLLLFTDQKVFVTDIYGNLIQEVSIPEGFGLADYSHMSVAPDAQSVIVTCNDFRLLRWDLADNTIQEFGKSITEVFGPDRLEMVLWSPDGRLLACSGFGQNGVRAVIANQAGEILHQISADDLASVAVTSGAIDHPMIFAWSPDSKSLAFDSGRLINIDGTVIRDLDVAVVDRIGEQEYSGSRRGTYPYWTSIGRIDFVNLGKSGPVSTGHVESFSPTGQKLATHHYGNLLRPSGAVRTSNEEAFLVMYHQGRSLNTPEHIIGFDQSGEVISVCPGGRPANDNTMQVISEWDGRTWQSDRYLPLVTRDRNGHEIGRYQPDEGWFKQGSGRFANNSGKLAFCITKESQVQVVVLDETLQEIAACEIPFEYPYVEMAWSPNDRYLACSWGFDGKAGFGVWDLDSSATQIVHQEINVNGEGSPRTELHWSPDSKQLAAIHVNENEQFHVYRPDTNETLVIPHRFSQHYSRNAPTWISSTQLLLNNELFEIPLDASTVKPPVEVFPALNEYDSLMSCPGRSDFVISRAGEGSMVAEFWSLGKKNGETAVPINWGRQRLYGQKAFLPIGPHYVDHVGMMQLDFETRSIDFLVFLTDDGRIIRLNAEGKLLNDIRDWDKYLSYVLRYPSGVEVCLSTAEFRARQSASPEEAALNWVLDAGGAVQVAGSQDWLDPRDARATEFSAADVTGIDLARCLIDDQSLSQLAHFPNLQTLVLRSSSLQSLDGLPEIPSLTQLDLSNLPVNDLSKLLRCPQMKDLRLAQTHVNSSSASTLTQLKNLETIDLTGTGVDRFLLLDWHPTNLKAIRLTNTRLSRDTDLQQLQTHFLPAHIENQN